MGEGVGEQEEDHDRWWKMVGLANANRDSLNVCVCVCVYGCISLQEVRSTGLNKRTSNWN